MTALFHFCIKKHSRVSCSHLDWEFELVVHLRHQKIMAESLPHLHDSNDGSVDLVLTVLEYSLCSAGLLFHL